MAKHFDFCIKEQAISSMFSFFELEDNLLLQTIKKESIEGFKKKVKLLLNLKRKKINK